MGCNMCVVQKPEEQHRVMLQVSGKEGPRRGPDSCRGGPRGSKDPLVLQVLRRSPRGRPPPTGGPPLGVTPSLHPWGGSAAPPPAPPGLVDSGTQTDITFESRLGPGGAEPPPLPHEYFDPADLGEPERPEELEYEEVELYKASHRDKLGLTVCYRTDGEEDAGIYVGEVNPNSIAAKDGRIREGDRIIQINGVEVQDREEAVAFLTQEQQTNISLLLARPESQRWKDSDREDFLDDFGSDEEGEVRQRGPWTPPGQPPSPPTPHPRGGGGAGEPDSGVGRTDESTRNDESSEHDLLGDEGGDPPPSRPSPHPRRPPPTPPPPPRGRTPHPPPPQIPEAALSQAEFRRYRQLRGRLGEGGGTRGGVGGSGGEGASPGGGGRGELALLEEELRHLEFKCRHLLRAQKMERLRERCLRTWLETGYTGYSGGGGGGGGGDGGRDLSLTDIAEAPERDSTSAYNTGESYRLSAFFRNFPSRGGKNSRGKRAGRDRLLKARAIKILEERGGGSTTDDDARSEMKTGRYWNREQRKKHLERAREQRRRRELLLLQNRVENGVGSGGGGDPPLFPAQQGLGGPPSFGGGGPKPSGCGGGGHTSHYSIPASHGSSPGSAGGVPNPHTGVHDPHTGVAKTLGGVPKNLGGVSKSPGSSGGVHTSHSSIPASHGSSPGSLRGNPNPHGGGSTPSGGVHDPQTGVSKTLGGVPKNLGGVPKPSSCGGGGHTSHSSIPASHGSIPGSAAGVPNPYGGVSNPHTGVPKASGGIPKTLGGVPKNLGGIPNPPGSAGGLPTPYSSIPPSHGSIPGSAGGVPNPHGGGSSPFGGLPPPPGGRRGMRKRSRRILDNWVTIQEMLARGTRGEGGRLYNPLLSVTTV